MAEHKPLLGIALMVLSTLLLATKDGVAKSFLDQVGPLQIIWFQYVGSFIILAAVTAPKYGWLVLTPKPLGWQMARGAFSAAGVTTLYWALTYIPLADATAVFMLAPIVVALLSPWLLKESVDRERKLAIAVGFLGVLVILRPGFGGNVAGYLIGVMAGALLGLYFIANRRLAGSTPPVLNIVHNSLTGAIVLSLFLPLFWITPPVAAAPKLAAIIVLAVFGQGLMISAFAYAPAGVVAPYTYAMLVFAAMIGYVVFGTFPDLPTWIGIALIVGAGLYIAQRERQIALTSAKIKV